MHRAELNSDTFNHRVAPLRTFAFFALAALLASQSLAADDAKKEELTGDLAKIQGKWTMSEMKLGDIVVPDTKAGMKMEFVGGVMKVTASFAAGPDGEKPADTRSIKIVIDEKQSPKHIDFTQIEGPMKDVTARALYELDGDTLRFCIPSKESDPRPADFGSGEKIVLMTLKRVK